MKILTFVTLTLLSAQVFAHSGRTDSSGCHTQKSTGSYHCHNSPVTTPVYTPPPTCTNGQILNTSQTACINPPPPTCTNGQILNTAQTACINPPPPTCSNGKILNTAQTACINPPPPTCTNGQILNSAQTACINPPPPTCSNGKILNTAQTACINPPPPTCTNGQVLNTSQTACITPPTCAKGQILNLAQTSCITLPSDFVELKYEGFTIWLDCEKRGAVKFQYNAQHDAGSFPRVEKFVLDKNMPTQCQQFTAKTYGKGYDRGHLVPANHLDYSAEAIKDTNNMTNILPQAANMNRGAWLQTEEIIECYRDIDELLVIGGVIWGNNPVDDYFVQSHGVKTPDAFWKVIVRGTGQSEQAIAWVVPNSKDATRKKLDSYLVTVNDIERLTGESIPVGQYAKDIKPVTSWLIPKGCNKG